MTRFARMGLIPAPLQHTQISPPHASINRSCVYVWWPTVQWFTFPEVDF